MKGKKKEQQDRRTQEDQEEPLEERESNFSGQNENTLMEGKKTATLEGPKKTLPEEQKVLGEGTAEPEEEKVLEKPPIEWTEPKRERKIMTNSLLLKRKQRKEKLAQGPPAHSGGPPSGTSTLTRERKRIAIIDPTTRQEVSVDGTSADKKVRSWSLNYIDVEQT